MRLLSPLGVPTVERS